MTKNAAAVDRCRKRIKSKALAYKGGKCIHCGYNACSKALDFHHLDRKQKKFNITSNIYRSWSKIKEELVKTVLLCANCHREVEAGLWTLD